MFPVLDADAPPNMRQHSGESESTVEQITQSFGTLREHLKRMPVGLLHDSDDRLDVLVRHILKKQVAHRIDEYHARLPPAQWLGKLLWHQPQVESLFIRVTGYAAKSLGKNLGVAVATAILN